MGESHSHHAHVHEAVKTDAQVKAEYDAKMKELEDKKELDKSKQSEVERQASWQREQEAIQRQFDREQQVIRDQQQQQLQLQLAEKLDANKAEAAVVEKAKEDFKTFDKWGGAVHVAKTYSHKAALSYKNLENPSMVVNHVNKLFEELPPNIRQELVRMATSVIGVVKSCKSVTEITDCRNQQETFNVPGPNINYTVRCSMAFRYMKATEEQTRAIQRLCNWMRGDDDETTLVAVAYQCEIGTQPMVEGAIDRGQKDELEAIGLI